MIFHFSELFTIKDGQIKPRHKYKITNDLNLRFAIRSFEENDQTSFTNAYFEVVWADNNMVLTKLFLN